MSIAILYRIWPRLLKYYRKFNPTLFQWIMYFFQKYKVSRKKCSFAVFSPRRAQTVMLCPFQQIETGEIILFKYFISYTTFFVGHPVVLRNKIHTNFAKCKEFLGFKCLGHLCFKDYTQQNQFRLSEIWSLKFPNSTGVWVEGLWEGTNIMINYQISYEIYD